MTTNGDIPTDPVAEPDAVAPQPVSNADGIAAALPDLEARLRQQVVKWRSKLLDLGNRNPLIHCSFNPTRGVVELAFPNTDAIWKRLVSDGAAGTGAMRFPWRRDLVPPPPEYLAEAEATASVESTDKKKREWNPPLDDCLASPRFSAEDNGVWTHWLVRWWPVGMGNDAATNSTLSAGGSVSRSQPRGGPAHHL